MLGNRVAVMSRFIECRRLPPNSTANGRIKRGTRRADQVSGMGAFSSVSAFDGATTLRLCIVLSRKLRECYLTEAAGSHGRIAGAHETASWRWIMVSPYRSLPPLPTLRTFEAVARQLSFTRAADELALTQSAVSHQIGALERHLGARLFSRLNPGIELTAEGRIFLDGARAGLDSILLATDRIRSRFRVGMLTISATSAFATWWLVPRLGRFAALHPEIEIRIAVIEGREPDLQRDGADVAIVQRPARAAADSAIEMPLLRETIFPVCAPTLLGAGPRRRIDLAEQTLIECEPEGEETAELAWIIGYRGSAAPMTFGHAGFVLPISPRRCPPRWTALASHWAERRWSMLSLRLDGWCGRSASEH